ncbi:MAG TPA: hypothetical protein VMX17_08635 [Candidatus Glassbacteria bacterium]|nr:hypothetical protein [Candidatus Glassbacteria bacterium]
MEDAILFGPVVGELYWECGRFAPMLPFYKIKKYRKQKPKFIILTREDRFDLYGRYADILVPLRINGDYEKCQPECFRLIGYSEQNVDFQAKKFLETYKKRFNILEHIYPNVAKGSFSNKNQFSPKNMIFKYKPRTENYEIVNKHSSNNEKPFVVISPRFRRGFKRNWPHWIQFYDTLYKDKELMNSFSFILCGKKGEYIPDPKHRFYDMNDMQIGKKSSLIGILLAIMEKTIFVLGSQSAIPNIALLYGVEVLEFGCQKKLHTITYNIKNTPITFIDDKKYNIEVPKIYKNFRELLLKKKGEM